MPTSTPIHPATGPFLAGRFAPVRDELAVGDLEPPRRGPNGPHGNWFPAG